MSYSSRSAQPSPAVWLVVLVVIGQAIALLINAALTITDPDSQHLPGTAKFFLVFLYAVGAVWLASAARGVYRGKAWPRGALVVAEILAVIVSFTYLQIGDIMVGIALLVSGGLILVSLFTPALNKHLVQRRSRTGN